MHAAAADTLENHGVGHVDFNHRIQRDSGLLQRFGLRQRAREAVKQKTAAAVVLGDALFDHADDDVVAY